MSKVSSLFFSLLVAAGAAFAAGVPELDLPKEIPDEPFDITAARIEYTNDTLIASGGVTGRFENATLIADRVSGKPETGDIHAEGDIYFERENVIWQGTELEYNYITQDGDFGPSSLNFDPILVSVEHVERVSTNEFMLKNAEFTTCQREHPHFNVRAKEARLIDQEYLKAKGVTVYVGRVPIFYLPYWRQKLSRSIFEFSMGNSSELGIYGLVKATVPVTENVDWISDLNLYSRRGVGFGQGVEWEFPHSIGEFSSFYIKDEDPNAKYGTDSDIGQLIDDDRYRFKFGGIHNFDDTHYINTKLNYLSDPAVLREFLRDEYRSYAQPENYASWVYGTRYVGTEALASYRLNDFYDNTDRAEYSLDLYRTRIPGTPLYVQSENSIASLERVHKTYDPSAGDYDSVRLDSMNSVFLPYRVGFLSFVPRATCRTTYYSKSEEFGEQFRTIPGFGMETLFQANKVLSDRERWYGKGLRHKIEPYTDIIWEDSSVNPEDLYQFDSVDRLRDEEKIKVGLRNVLQTKRNGRLSRFIDLDLYSYYLIENHGSDHNFDSLFLDARMPLTERTMIDMEGVCDWNNGTVPFFNTRIYQKWDELTVSLEHLYRENKDSLWTPRFNLFPERKWSFEGYARYEGENNDLEEIALSTYYSYCCMRYGLGAHFYDDNEYSFMFSLTLLAFPEVGISSSL